ncbi:MAG: hypothetical protein P4L69_02780 [Desulfosporosinus sp.]|nr:hypothetical protein [Desulfosporosinus sp.]
MKKLSSKSFKRQSWRVDVSMLAKQSLLGLYIYCNIAAGLSFSSSSNVIHYFDHGSRGIASLIMRLVDKYTQNLVELF